MAILWIAAMYGGGLALLPLDEFLDRENYLAYAANSWDIFLRYWDSGALITLANDPLWLLINAALGRVFSPEITLRALIFAPATVVAYIVLTTEPRHFLWLLLILFVPQVIKNHVIHLRQGAAISVFLMGWFSPSRFRHWILLSAAPMVHSSFFFILALLLMTGLFERLRLAADFRTLGVASAGILVGTGLGWLATSIGARQAEEYVFGSAPVSGLGFVFWFAMLVVFLSEGGAFRRRHAFECGIVVFYLSTYFLVEVTARIFESGLVIVLLSGLALTGWRRQIHVALLLFYSMAYWMSRVEDPWMGFGILT
jgi:hypothetical protein